MFKNLKFEQVVLFLLIGYIIFNRLVEQSGSQELLKETEQKAKNAEALSQQALMRTQAIEEINRRTTHIVYELNKVNESTLDEIQAINKRYKSKKDSLYESLDDRLFNVRKNLKEIQRIQNQL